MVVVVSTVECSCGLEQHMDERGGSEGLNMDVGCSSQPTKSSIKGIDDVAVDGLINRSRRTALATTAATA
jgi:hypothetical protein